MPLVSVVVPVHNGGALLRGCLSSITGQTLKDIEIIVVDDNSTDDTRSVVEEFSAEDPRVSVVAGPGVGSAGAARNVGLDLARGDYLSFLDADDTFSPVMLEKMYDRAAANQADIVLSKFQIMDERTGDLHVADWSLRLTHFPRRARFGPDAVGDSLFFAVNPAAWNKLFRTEFIRAAGLRFQDLRRVNDAYFTYMALAHASSLTYVDNAFVSYRIGNPTSLQSTLDETPLEFVDALTAMRDKLRSSSLFDGLERAFVNEALEMCLTALTKAPTAKAFSAVRQALLDDVLDRFGITGRPDGYFLQSALAQGLSDLLTMSAEELLFSRLQAASQKLDRSLAETRAALRVVDLRSTALASSAAQLPPSTTDAPAATSTTATAAVDVSVIIPVYNAERFLGECLASVQRQTQVSLEIICVDDGSTDSSGELLRRAAALDERISVVTQANAGQSVARNVGLDRARGRYVCFVDSDDSWQLDGLASLVSRADDDALDLLLFDGSSVREPGVSGRLWKSLSTYYARQGSYPDVLTGPGMLARMRAEQDYRASPCLYLVRRDYLQSVGTRFYPGISYEDNLFTFALMLDAARVGHSPTAFYSRRVRPGSIRSAGARLAAVHGNFISFLEMLRLTHGRRFEDDTVAEQIGSVILWRLLDARDDYLQLPSDVAQRLRETDAAADAQTFAGLLWRLRFESQFKNAQRKTPASQDMSRRAAGRGRTIMRSLLTRLRGATGPLSKPTIGRSAS